MKKIISLLLSLLLLVSASSPASVFATEDSTYHTTDGMTAVFNAETKTLTVSGNGKIADRTKTDRAPYYEIFENIENIVIEEGVTSIGNYAFYSFTSAKTVTLPSTLEYLGEYSFSECKALLAVEIPESVGYIGEFCFRYCSSLKSANVPKSFSYIPKGIFALCFKLTDVSLPDSYSEIRDSAFAQCRNLDFTIPEGVTHIGNRAFQADLVIKKVVIPSTVTYIGDYAFDTCSSLSDITVPKSVTHIGYRAFADTAWWKKLPYGINTVNGITLNSRYNTSQRPEEIEIPDGTATISTKTCLSLPYVRSISIPNTVTKIEEEAFFDLSSLGEITVPDSVTYIGERAIGFLNDENGLPVARTGFKIYGHAGTAAKEYADLNGFDFVCLHEEDDYSSPGCEGGEVSTFCKWCHIQLRTLTFNQKEHSFSDPVTVLANCTEDGKIYIKCSDCGCEKVIETFPANGHTPSGNYNIKSYPNCTAEGKIFRICSVCNEKCDYKSLPANGHTPSENYFVSKYPTCTDSGVSVKICTVCGEICETVVTDPVGHSAETWTIITAATKKTQGFRVKECAECGDIFLSEFYEYEYLVGDINKDGRINARDVLALSIIISGSYSGSYDFKLCDINGDGKIRSTDLIFLKIKLGTGIFQ